jgi:hypothetical protein
MLLTACPEAFDLILVYGLDAGKHTFLASEGGYVT